MAGSDSRGGVRPWTPLRIKLKFEDVETFIQKYSVNISRGGIFIATRQPQPVGTVIRFEFLLAGAEQPVLKGEGQVQWIREFDPAQPNKAHGIGLRFAMLDPESQKVIERALAFRQREKEREGGAAPREVVPLVDTGPTPLVPPPPRPPPTPRSAPPPPPRPAVGRPPNIETRPISLNPRGEIKEHADGRASSSDELDALATEWGVSAEQLARTLAKVRPNATEAPEELAQLLRKNNAPAPSKADALARLSELLARRKPR